MGITAAAQVAPYITAWSAEQSLPCQLVERPGYGLVYADELLTDRDGRGVLWQRSSVRQTVGRPEFGKVHRLRQRRAMLRLLCQVCSGPADQTGDGVLWLLRDHRDDWRGWPEGMASVEPPVCVPCVAVSLKLCPALRRGAAAVRVREFPVVGVRGALYQQGAVAPVAIEAVNVAYDDPVVRWVVASALVRELRDCTVVPTEELAGTRL
ncbi:hypothetical protein UK23_13425 [Lentzea aerocolonigenes]|uniref:Uncharacterized protein n=2 Tax=Lentzea aerocolonigenes TaxID=68170 RepID=A0A0F0H1K7_LENAE|nr:hypothetical protein UK23_13425 [Lentzea aerocolonigenes]